jgi:hypothetical protein
LCCPARIVRVSCECQTPTHVGHLDTPYSRDRDDNVKSISKVTIVLILIPAVKKNSCIK